MRTIIGALALAVVVILIVVGPAAAVSLDSDDTTFTVGEQDVTVNEDFGAVAVDATARLERVDLSFDAPDCDLKTDGEGVPNGLPDCKGGAVDANAAPPSLELNVGVRFGNLEAAPDDGSDLDAAASVANAPTPLSGAALFVATAAAGASAAAGYGVWRFLKFIGLAGMMPLYSHISDDRLLDEPNRAAICALVRAEPGVSTKDIADRLDLAWGTVTHHLAKLEKRRLVVSKKYGKYRRYFVNGAEAPQGRAGFTLASTAEAPRTPASVARPASVAVSADVTWKDALAVLRVPTTAEVASHVARRPGLTQKAAGEALGVSSSTILWHVKRLEHVGLVHKVRDGKMVRYYPTDALLQGASPLGGAPVPPGPKAPAYPA